MHVVQERLVDDAAGDRRLIGDDDRGEAGALEQPQRVGRPREDVEELEPIEVAALLDERAVTIEKHGGRRRRFRHQLTDRWSTTRSGDSPFMHRWSIGHSRSIQGRHQTW